jgi:hypothetical protein
MAESQTKMAARHRIERGVHQRLKSYENRSYRCYENTAQDISILGTDR